nr:short-chain dehydrogenase [Actinomycetota bacterium]
REYWVGYPTVGAILANHLVPGLLDRYLARTNIEAQQTDLPVRAGRPDNLEEPMAGSQGAHSIFDDQAKSRSFQSRLSMYR